jgi:hypothetical protein
MHYPTNSNFDILASFVHRLDLHLKETDRTL